jgi:hypothetical protein
MEAAMSAADFDWFGDEDVVVREQAAIAVYQNVRGNIAIRQKGDLNPETLDVEDVVIVVTPRHAAELARAILDLAEPERAQQLVLPAPMTPAERQRKRRDKQRDSVTTQRDTERDSRDSATDLFVGSARGTGEVGR